MRPAHLLLLTAAAVLVAAAAPAGVERARLDARLARLRAAEARSLGAAASASARLSGLTAQEAQLQARIGRNRGELIRLLGALERWRADPPPALLVSPQRAVDAARGALLMRAITPELERRARTLAVQARALQGVRRQAAMADAALFTAESDAADRQEAVDAVAARKAALDAMLLSPQARAAQAPTGVGATATDRQPDAVRPPRLLAPVQGAVAFGWDAPWPGRGEAQGIVWRPAADAPVRAPAAGRVEYVGPLKGSRLVLILRLAGDWRVVLTGLQTVTVGEAADVAAGAPIGRAPPAGAGDADVYLQLRDGPRTVDPTPLLATAGKGGRAPALRGSRPGSGR